MCIVKNTFPERGLNVPCLPRDYSDGAWIMRIFILKRNFNPAVLRKPFIPMEVKKSMIMRRCFKEVFFIKKEGKRKNRIFYAKNIEDVED